MFRFPDQIDRLRTVSWPSIRDGTVADGPAVLVRISAAADASLTVIWIAALAAVLLPHVRERLINVRYRLSPADPDFRARLAAAAGRDIDVPIALNAAGSNESAITYPRGWRPQIGVFAPIVVGLRADPERSGFIVRHELAHARAGDHLLGGTTGPLRPIARYTFPVLLAVVALTIVFPGSYSESRAASIVNAVNSFVAVSALIVALWLAELEADRYAAEEGPTPRELFDHRQGWRRLLTHPPSALRRLALRAWQSTPTSAAILLLYPLTVVVRWLIALAAGIVSLALIPNTTTSDAWDLIGDNALWAARRSAGDMIVFGALLIAWPWVGALWRRLWGFERSTGETPWRPGNVLAGAICICLALVVRSVA